MHALRGVILCLLIGCAGCGKKETAAPTAAPAFVMPVSVANVLRKEINEWDEFTGKLEAVDQVLIRPRISGAIEKIHFKEGTEVKQGDPLFQIDPRPFQAELKRVEAEAARVSAQLQLARAQLARSEELVKSGFISKQGMDEKIHAEREAAAGVEAVNASIASARLNLGYTRIAAPIAGRIGRAEVTVGNMVSGENTGNATVLASIVSMDPIYAYFEADEQVFLKYSKLRVEPNQPKAKPRANPVFMGLADEDGFPHQGQLDFVDNQLNPSTGTIRARALFANEERKFTPGLFARLKITGSATYPAILISDKAIGTDQSKKFVLVVGQDNKVAYREVKLGPMVDGLRIVRDGLKPDERIVVNGLQRVRPGMPVKPQLVPMLDTAPNDKPQS